MKTMKDQQTKLSDFEIIKEFGDDYSDSCNEVKDYGKVLIGKLLKNNSHYEIKQISKNEITKQNI